MSNDQISDLRNEFARSLDRLTDKLDVFTQRLEAIATKQAEQARDIKHGACPQPGACIDLRKDLHLIDARLVPLENAFREAEGARRARLAIGAAISAGAGILGAFGPQLLAMIRG